MDSDEIISKKDNLEGRIAALIRDFEETTGAQVDDVTLFQTREGSEPPKTARVDVDIFHREHGHVE